MGEDFSSGRARASWGDGHAINAGLPQELPFWLYQIGRTKLHAYVSARRGERVGPVSRVNWTKTLRRWGRLGHFDAQWLWRRDMRSLGRLVILWDISGSMTTYLGWYFPWIYRLVSVFNDVRIFAFGTDIEDLSPYLSLSYSRAVANLYEKTVSWGSGTAIGHAFETWVAAYGGQLLSHKTTVIVISDGWDVGTPERLETALREMASKARQIAWINPLMATKGFEPRTRALQVALRYTRSMSAGATPAGLLEVGWRLGYR